VAFKFCVPECADIIVTLQNCMSFDECGDTYSYPDLFLSRTEVIPKKNDYSFKLATTSRRYIFVNHTDPSARDPNGYLVGSYYVSVYGWCTPDEYAYDLKVDGPCSYADKTLFNVTVDIIPRSGNESCPDNELVYNTLPSAMIEGELESGVAVTGTIGCNEYQYYTMNVPSACSSLNIWVGDSSNSATTVPELAISQWPNLRPTFDNMAWIAYEWMENNVTISTFDPNFFGGKRCGKHKNETCIAVIGVLGYCVYPNGTEPFQFTLKATISPAHKMIYGEPKVHNGVSANGTLPMSSVSRRTRRASLEPQTLLWN